MNGFSTCDEDSRDAHGQQCCLRDGGSRCARSAGNASYNKRIEKIVSQRRLKLVVDADAQHIYICEFHKSLIQSARTRKRRRHSDDLDAEEGSTAGGGGTDASDVNLHQLHVNTLRRYKRHYKIPTRPGMNKAQLAEILMKHLRSLPVVEKDVLTYFIYTVKTNRNRLHQKATVHSDNG